MGRSEQISQVIDNLRRIFQAVGEYSRSAERETELTGPQLWALKILDKQAPLRVSELARQMYLRPATVVGILDRLEAKGLVTRTRSTQDRRAVDLELTDTGRGLVAKAPEVAQIMLVNGLSALDEEEFGCVIEGMQHMVKILGAEHLMPQPLHS
ncbi:MarR family transcriptional regulator [Geomonas nitrogeniifigens]|uniref:MarR family transcriptional regulator n=1 Tax=Geomonas diazotrophica TaxID=2843197 RepID=A0ABX8JGW4_9BACT|nr:MarR family transcriptional regulator [Geomonas nitrogeniifigens]QWV96457.1 MarR family transcriptional regulator [Geomonas nitrogeniifigens]QXE86458.1 MarR family transcriptional regulator [Geomonas nitrogeniifigens]